MTYETTFCIILLGAAVYVVLVVIKVWFGGF